jgi:prepilin-type processing-associated H-X9-DG protein/prepilin-type N-terminal cleavage/methylation domain-containing protein
LKIHSKTSAFTLIELLVVLAVIAILAVLTVPAVNSAKAQSLRTKCASNVGQLGKACLLYAQDNEGCLPKSSCDDPSNPSDCWTNSLQPYAGKTLLFRCPADEAKTRSRTYVINDYLTQMPCDAVTGVMNQNHLVCVEKPSQTVFLMELSKTYGATVPPDHLHLAQYYGSDIPLGDFQSQVGVERHLGKANYLFLDGHVESISWKDAQTMINAQGSRFINPLPTE